MSLKTRTLKNERHFLSARENVDYHYDIAHKLAKQVVERAYPPEDVASVKNFQKEIWKSL